MLSKAAVLYRQGMPARIETIEVDPPKAGEVLVAMAAAGVCHSDLHVRDGLIPEPIPLVLGHEGSGVVVEVGPGVTSLRPADHVVLTLVPACGHCYFCDLGQPHLCVRSGEMACSGTLADGTPRFHGPEGDLLHFNSVSCFSEYVVVPESGAVRIPEDFPLETAALLGCAVVTGVGAVLRTAGVRAGESAVVIGAGGVGLNVIQALRIVGAHPIVAVDIAPEKLALAASLGAHHTVLRPQDDLQAAREAYTPYGFDWAFEVLGRPETILDAWSMIRAGGSVVVVGLAAKTATVPIPAFDFIQEKNLRGCFYGSTHFRADLGRLVEWVRLGWLKLDPLVSRRRPLAELEEAFEDLRRGTGVRTLLYF